MAEALQDSIDSFSQLLVLDWVWMPDSGDGAVRLSMFTGAPRPDDGVGTADSSTWRQGTGTVYLNPESFGTHGAQESFKSERNGVESDFWK
jgi:hypothetical protein